MGRSGGTAVIVWRADVVVVAVTGKDQGIPWGQQGRNSCIILLVLNMEEDYLERTNETEGEK